MNWKAFIVSAVITAIVSIILIICLSGCSGLGLDKSATLVPDSVGVTWGQQRFREEAAAYRGFMIHATWDLK